jgi:hypothetical protein
MKKNSRKSKSKRVRRSAAPGARDELRPEYDFSHGERGRYAERYHAGTNLVLLEPDVAERFPDSEAVNRALRSLFDDAPATSGRRRRRRTA